MLAARLRVLVGTLIFSSLAAPAAGAHAAAAPDAAAAVDDAAAPAPAASVPEPPPIEKGSAPPPPPEGGGHLFEQLSGSAYPAGRNRGLYGGSLWFSPFHGLQWPYIPRTGIGFSGYVWLDNSYERLDRGDIGASSFKRYLQQGRFLFRVTPTYSDGRWFVQGQGELVLNKEQVTPLNNPDTDDVWIRTGHWKSWDLQVGRFEAWEVYHLGMGLDLNTLERQGAFDLANPTPDLYGVTFAFYRNRNAGNVALHLYPTDYLRFELLAQVGNDGSNTLGGRPAAIFDLGWFKLRGAAEYLKRTPETIGQREVFTFKGAGGSAQFILDPYVEFGANFAAASVVHTDNGGALDGSGSYTSASYGGFANVALPVIDGLMLGVGFNRVDKKDKRNETDSAPGGRAGSFNHLQLFAAVQYLIGRQLFVKAVVGYADAYYNPDPTFYPNPAYNDKMTSLRVRLTYLF
jgi:hypothetical protein